MVKVAISGGFDPLTSGHIDLIEGCKTAVAKYVGETHPHLLHVDVDVILNSDEWLVRKKGKPFMNWWQRARILSAMKDVFLVCRVDDLDGTVCEALRRRKPDYFANGGDRKEDNTPELDVCEELGIIPLFNVGGGKTQSSSELLEDYGSKY